MRASADPKGVNGRIAQSLVICGTDREQGIVNGAIDREGE